MSSPSLSAHTSGAVAETRGAFDADFGGKPARVGLLIDAHPVAVAISQIEGRTSPNIMDR